MFLDDLEDVSTLSPPCTQATFKSPALLGLKIYQRQGRTLNLELLSKNLYYPESVKIFEESSLQLWKHTRIQSSMGLEGVQ